MSSRHVQLTLAVLVFSAAVLLTLAQSALAADVCATPPVMITLHLTPDGSCTQESGGNIVAGPIQVSPKQCVKYAGAVIDANPTATPPTPATPATFDVTFDDGPSPFSEFATSTPGDTVTAGQVTGTSGHTYYYSSVQIGTGTKSCSNGKKLGLIMK
ncbi:MAG: hypothetical protein ABSD63_10425 [Candidatus Korobacteraceae bacterium]